MDEQDQISEYEEGLDLEDIMKEFSEDEQPAGEETPGQEAIQQTQVIPSVSSAKPVDEPEDKAKTRRLPKLKDKKKHKEEAATEPEATVSEATQVIPAQELPQSEQEQDQEYVPYKPILFQPKDRLRSLKRKLVAGPESGTMS